MKNVVYKSGLEDRPVLMYEPERVLTVEEIGFAQVCGAEMFLMNEEQLKIILSETGKVCISTKKIVLKTTDIKVAESYFPKIYMFSGLNVSKAKSLKAKVYSYILFLFYSVC